MKFTSNSFFYYKGGIVVGAASNSSEAAKSAFAFMISSTVSKYKEYCIE